MGDIRRRLDRLERHRAGRGRELIVNIIGGLTDGRVAVAGGLHFEAGEQEDDCDFRSRVIAVARAAGEMTIIFGGLSD